jgi:S-adenosylmethionine synthetase
VELVLGCLNRSGEGEIEVVERKGLGHPDTVCDALSERVSCALSEAYLERFGTILHHNVDKALLVGGASRTAFGGGEVIEPIEIHLAGRAVGGVGDAKLDVTEIALESARAWLRQNLTHVDVARHVKLYSHLRAGSVDLRSLYRRGQETETLANDTSYGVGFAPLSALEGLVLELERELNDVRFRKAHPEGGEDVKIMAARRGDRVEITLARAFVGKHLENLAAYFDAKAALTHVAEERARARFPEASVRVNASDGSDAESVYLTVTGTSAEAGDDGEVGRGNRVNGLITPYRPMSLEAAAGKNSVSHAGKLYNLLAHEIAGALCRELGKEVRFAQVMLISRIGHPIRKPRLVHIELELDEPSRLEGLGHEVRQVASDHLSRVGALWQRVLRGELTMY